MDKPDHQLSRHADARIIDIFLPITWSLWNESPLILDYNGKSIYMLAPS